MSSFAPKGDRSQKPPYELSECDFAKQQRKQRKRERRIAEEISSARAFLLDIFGELPRNNTSVDSLKEAGVYIKEYKEKLDMDLATRFANLAVPRQLTIYCLHKTTPTEAKYLTPRVVSIGPYHHGKSHLAKMDAHKNRYLKDFLDRNPGKTYKQYRKELKMLEPYLRVYYPSELNFTIDGFIDMMLLDGCFILELLVKTFNSSRDEIFEDLSLLQYIKSDLLIFENQIPLMVLEKLHGPKNMGSLPGIDRLLANYFWDTRNGLPMLRSTKSHNLLHFYYLQFIPPYVDKNCKGTNLKKHGSLKLHKQQSEQIPSVLVLVKSGIVFKGKLSSDGQ